MPYNSITNSANAEALIPTEISKEIIKETPQSSVVMQLGHKLPNMSSKTRSMPVLSALPMAYFVDTAPGTNGSSHKQTTKAEWENKYLRVGEIAAIAPIPESVLDDSEFDIWGEIKPAIAEAIGQVFDKAVLYGLNAPSDWPTDILTAAGAAGHEVALGTGADLFDDLMSDGGLLSKIEEDGYISTGHIAALTMRAKLRGLRDENGQPLFSRSMQDKTGYELDGSPILFPINGAIDPATSLLITGQWNKLVWAIRQDITFRLLTEAVITDPSTNEIVYNLAQQDMVALRVVARFAWQLPNPINRINSNATTRYPFAVLTPAVSGS